jgi:RNA polymerase sigma-70 factor (ECF subfamily)
LHDFDQAYLGRLAAADPATEGHFIEYFGALMRIKLRRRVRQREWIDDICQETFLRVLRAVRSPGEGVRHAERLGAYVHAVCNNVMLEHFRASTRHPQIAEGAPEAPDRGDDAEASLLGEEKLAAVRRTIDDMPGAKDRLVLRALFVEERDKDELCAELGVDRAYLRVLLHRAKQQFKARYADGGAKKGMDGGRAARGKLRRFRRPGRGL